LKGRPVQLDEYVVISRQAAEEIQFVNILRARFKQRTAFNTCMLSKACTCKDKDRCS